ncbi:hypothetical protein [uncultured Sphingomonas sp.]|uniref:hypothetical protein n=1 Tax=uncultured Sphingomonas sp. TaxID=158754 RepID=UPI0035CC7D63
MQASYDVSAQPERNLILITLAGFFRPDDLAGFDRVRRAALDRLRCGLNQHDTIVDVHDLRLQTQAMVEAFRDIIAAPETQARRLAIVTGDAAVRMQVRRVIERDAIRCFADIGAAEDWLAAPAGSWALAG